MRAGAWYQRRRWPRPRCADEVRELGRGGAVTIRWDEPHELTVDDAAVKRAGVTVTGHARVVITAPGRRIAFSTATAAGMLGVAAKLPGGKELAGPGAAIARMVERSAAARPAGGGP